MGKKKRQNQSSNNPVGGGGGDSSSESESSKDSTTAQANAAGEAASKTTCQHIKKSVDLGALRKNVKINKDKNTHCTCSFSKNESEPCKANDSDSGGGGWVCLRCASFNCAAHRLNHFLVPHSDSHALACHTADNSIWCFKCEKEIPVDAQKLVQSSADFVKKQYNDALGYPIKHETDAKKMNGETSFPDDKQASSSKQVEGQSSVKDLHSSLPRVRGLLNLGNTCFFNSVLQCLAQTPGLTALLDEMDVPGEQFTIQLDGVTVDAQLEKVKQSMLSEQLALVLKQVACGGGTSAQAVNPRRLLSALTSRCRQFEGYDQHDAHELLRHLLDSVHSEDLKRYQKAILDHIGYKHNNLEELDVEKKLFGKKLNQKVCDTIPIRPDHIFKGSLVSILVCTVCGHKSKREETFLDLSLPVLPEKAHHIKKKVSCSSPVEEKQTAEVTLSKHQLKKEKKHARKNRKHNKYTNKNDQENQGEPTIEEEDKKGDSVDDDQSDADVEDNDEGDQKAEVVESGYSSEKQASARGSPVAAAVPRELTVAIPRPTEAPDDTSQDSVRVNASNGSPDTSPGHGERESSPAGPDLPGEGERVDSATMIYRWSCAGEAEQQESGSASLSNSPRSASAKDGASDDNMSICTSLPENVSMCLNSPAKSGAEDRPESRMDVYSENKNRSSPVETAGEGEACGAASLDSGLLSLTLRGIQRSDKSAAESSPEKPDTVFTGKFASGDAADMVVPPARPSVIPLPPPLPQSIFTSAYMFGSAPEPMCTVRARFKYHIEEGECSLQSCLHQFTSIEMLTANNKVGCDACTEKANKGEKDGKTVYQNSTKQLLICSLPPVMIFHLKRFEVQRFSFRKLSRSVEFPLVLDISQFCADPAESVLYSLYGVVEHSGNMHGGHYVAYVKVRARDAGSRWYYISDSHVREADERSVLNSQAYLLFYERIH